MHRLLIALSFCAACTATVRTAPPPAEPAGPPPAPPPSGPVATTPPPAPMPPPGNHPAYVDAINNLRQARALLQRAGAGGAGDVKWDEKVAVGEIEAALRDIRNAHMDDGRPMDEHPPINNKLVYRDRLREAWKLLDTAAHDIAEREDNAWAAKDRTQAAEHIRRASKSVQEAIGERAEAGAPPPPAPPAPPPPPANTHPAYVTAYANLRQARALLDRPAGTADVKFDQGTAIHEIDEAMKQIRQARQDDGRPMTEHPPIENTMVYRDRLREAWKLLDDAAHDIGEREDNAWAKTDRAQAAQHIRRASKAVQEAIGDRKADQAEKKEEKREEKAEKKAAKGH